MMGRAAFRRLKSPQSRLESAKQGEARVARYGQLYDVKRPQRAAKSPQTTGGRIQELRCRELPPDMANAAYFAVSLLVSQSWPGNQRSVLPASAGASLAEYMLVNIYLKR
jgi:hypothetical protein